MAGPLTGVRVIEMANFISGPYAVQLLADLGAEVIKIEMPGAGDPFRQWGERRGPGYRPQFAAYNRGKKSVTINIKTAEGREAVRRLLTSADVFVENNRPGALDRAGLGWNDAHALNPRLIYCSISGFGSAGPYRDRPTYDAIAQAISGFQSMFTEMDDPKPLGPASSDQLTGMYAAYGILGALYSRERSGEGQYMEVNMMASSMAFLTEPLANYLIEGEVSDPHMRPRRSQSYAFLAQDGLPMAIHLSSPHKFWLGLTAALGREDLREDPRFKEQPSRVRNYDELKREVQAIIATRPRAEWLETLARHDVPCSPINNVKEAIEDEQARFLGLAQEVGSGDRAVRLVANPVDYRGTPARPELPPPNIAEHNEEILEELGFSADEIAAMQGGGD